MKKIIAVACLVVAGAWGHALAEPETVVWNTWQDKLIFARNVPSDYKVQLVLIGPGGKGFNTIELPGEIGNGAKIKVVDSAGIAVITGIEKLGDWPWSLAFDLRTGKELWRTQFDPDSGVLVGQNYLLGYRSPQDGPTSTPFYDLSTLKPLAASEFRWDSKESLSGRSGVYQVVQEGKAIEFWDATTGAKKWTYVNDWGKDPVQLIGEMGQFFAFEQDANAYLINQDGKLVKEFKASFAAALENSARIYTVNPGTGIEFVNPGKGATIVTFKQLAPRPDDKKLGWQVRYKELILNDNLLLIGLTADWGGSATNYHIPPGSKNFYVVLDAADGHVLRHLLRPGTNELPLVGFNGAVKWFPEAYYSPDEESGGISREPQGYFDLFRSLESSDADGTFTGLDVTSGKKNDIQLPANPSYIQGKFAYIWNENNQTLYAYGYPNWTKGKELWSSTAESWKTPGMRTQETQAQQLKKAKSAFQTGDYDLAIKQYEALGPSTEATASILLARIKWTEVSIGNKDIDHAKSNFQYILDTLNKVDPQAMEDIFQKRMDMGDWGYTQEHQDDQGRSWMGFWLYHASMGLMKLDATKEAQAGFVAAIKVMQAEQAQGPSEYSSDRRIILSNLQSGNPNCDASFCN